MSETRLAAIERLLKKWEDNARHFDDYRGILMCIRELKETLARTEIPSSAEMESLIKRTKDFLEYLKGKPFVTGSTLSTLVTELLESVIALDEKFKSGFTGVTSNVTAGGIGNISTQSFKGSKR